MMILVHLRRPAMKKHLLKWFCPALTVAVLAACGGGGSSADPSVTPPVTQGATIITTDNYVDVAGLTIVAVNRLRFLQDAIDAAFELILNTSDIPGTYPCPFGGTLTYAKTGLDYTFSASSCDANIAGERVLLQSGSMSVGSPVVQTTSLGTAVGYFLTSATITFNAVAVVEKGVVSTVSGSTNWSAVVTSPSTAAGRTTGASLTILRAGRADVYTDINVTGIASLFDGNSITGGSMTVSSPRAPGVLSVTANGTTVTSTAADNSQSVLSSDNEIDFSLQFAIAGATQASSSGNTLTGPLAQGVSKALQ